VRVIPAIDIKGGKVVRLSQGDASKETIYSLSPIEIARRWASSGVELIHVVDLDGALTGRLVNFDIIKEMAGSIKAKIELGGGIRDADTVQMILDSGIDKVVIGTRALDNDFLKDIGKRFGRSIVAGIDAKDGLVRTKGWVSETGTKAIDLARRIEAEGIRTVIYTDISRDGMMEGPNIPGLEAMLGAVKLDVIASGGVSTIDDLRELKALESKGLVGVIVGKALYEGKIDLLEAVNLC
jgi:phosphoribosylformimino-5-aminoimidazole carboxamide ribotide isomerase